MATIDFPSSPTVGQVYTNAGRSWVWTGSVWNAYSVGVPTISASDGPPASALPNEMWYETDSGKTYIFYDGYWVEMTSAPSGVAAASAVPFTPVGTIAATNVQAAIAEVANEAPRGVVYHHQPGDSTSPSTTLGGVTVPGFPGPVCKMTGGRAYRITSNAFQSSANNYVSQRMRAQFTGSDTYSPFALLLTQPTDMASMPIEWYYTPPGAAAGVVVDVTLTLTFGVYFGSGSTQIRNDLVQPFIHVDDIGLYVAPV